MILNEKQSFEVEGGAKINASLFNAFSRIVKTIYDIGYSFGSTIRRTITKKYC